MAGATITRPLCTIAGFYRYAVEEDLIEHSPAAHVRRPRVDYESHATGLDRNELGAILVAAGLGGPAEHALIPSLALNGLRVSEATGANIEALGTERGHRTLTITRKGGKVVAIAPAPRTARAIDLAIGERSDGPVFLVPDGRRFDRHGAARIVRRVAGRWLGLEQARPGRTRSGTHSSRQLSMLASPCAMFKRPPPTPTRGPRYSLRPCPRQPGPARHLHRCGLRRGSIPVGTAVQQRPPPGRAATARRRPGSRKVSQHLRRRSRRRTDSDRQPVCLATNERGFRRTTTGTRVIRGPGATTSHPAALGGMPPGQGWNAGPAGNWMPGGRKEIRHAGTQGGRAMEQGRAEPPDPAYRALDAWLGRGRSPWPPLRPPLPDTGQCVPRGRRLRHRSDLRPADGLGQERSGRRRLRTPDPRPDHPAGLTAPVSRPEPLCHPARRAAGTADPERRRLPVPHARAGLSAAPGQSPA